MEEFILHSYCGLYCGLYCGSCEIMDAYRKSRENGAPAKWEDLPEQLRNNIRSADIICHGCKTDTVFAGCRGCRVRECARERQVMACVVCPDFPCDRVEELRSLLPGIRERLPHTASIFGGTETARNMGHEALAEAQRAQWQCPGCGAPFTWYQERCGVCRRALNEIRGY